MSLNPKKNKEVDYLQNGKIPLLLHFHLKWEFLSGLYISISFSYTAYKGQYFDIGTFTLKWAKFLKLPDEKTCREYEKARKVEHNFLELQHAQFIEITAYQTLNWKQTPAILDRDPLKLMMSVRSIQYFQIPHWAELHSRSISRYYTVLPDSELISVSIYTLFQPDHCNSGFLGAKCPGCARLLQAPVCPSSETGGYWIRPTQYGLLLRTGHVQCISHYFFSTSMPGTTTAKSLQLWDWVKTLLSQDRHCWPVPGRTVWTRYLPFYVTNVTPTYSSTCYSSPIQPGTGIKRLFLILPSNFILNSLQISGCSSWRRANSKENFAPLVFGTAQPLCFSSWIFRAVSALTIGNAQDGIPLFSLFWAICALWGFP